MAGLLQRMQQIKRKKKNVFQLRQIIYIARMNEGEEEAYRYPALGYARWLAAGKKQQSHPLRRHRVLKAC